ncbi:type 4a pilus biogenesis protein PilO [Entomomonas sp. E2T0]|uniref:type 4a pilus biogenesis protein PilO n=1 Tax=Entomomonas sp. E2T0 TaxID=2930213 RepID=UPI00222842F9|nr:type 4a pilus biogenesis protein PilO [Entomomonas sp. E2T0]UYZ82630.1 type 4a pilus biogenesis protein PilO [Entomomonas sp. E2T0]
MSLDLKSLDLNNLDLKSPGTWPLPIMVLACLLVLIVICVLGYNFVLSDVRASLEKARGQEPKLKADFETKAAQSASLNAYKAQMDAIEESFSGLLKQLPAETEVPGLIEDVTKAGLTSGLEFKQIRLQKEVKQPFYVELPVQITITGNYHAFANFATKVAALPRIVTLNDFSIKPEVVGDSSKLTINVLAKTYRYREDVK